MQTRPAPRAGGAGAAALAAAMGLPGTPPSANSTDGARDPGASSGGDPSPGVVAAQGAIVFSGVGAEGVTPPGTDIEISPKAVPSDGDISHGHQAHGSTSESRFHVPMGGSISSMPSDEDISHGHQAHGSTSRSIFHVLTEENISPRSTSVDGSVFHEHRGCGFTSESLFHVSMGGSVPQEHPKDGSVSPMSMPMGGSSLLQHREPEGSDEDDADEGTDSGSEEDEDEDEDEEPHFHTNPLFQSPPPPPDAELSAPLALPPGSGHIPRLRLQWGGLDPSGPPTPTDPPRRPPSPVAPIECPHRSPSPIAPIELPQRSPSPITPIEPPLEPPSPITSIEPHHGPPSPITPIEPPQPPPSPTDAPHQPLGEGSPPPSPPRGSPIPGHGCAPGSPPAPPPTQELPPERGAEPPASAQGSPAGGSRAHARLLASRLFRLDGVRRSEVAAFLRRGDAFSAMVAHEYLEWFQFGGQALDQALRSFLRALALSGETQERERVLGHFSRRFHHCNPGAFPSPDAVHSLTCALMLLNTDLHGQRLGRAMSSAQFVANLRGMMDGQDFPRQQLKALYSSIRRQKLPWAVVRGMGGARGGRGGSRVMLSPPRRDEEEEAPPGPRSSESRPELPGGAAAVTHRGCLARKVLAEADGRKTPWGRRGWKRFEAVLEGTLLHLRQAGAPPEAPLGVHHALAERAAAYTKRPDVFRLRTADGRRFLFQAPTPREMQSWIARLNLAAALLSAPPFPAAVGSRRGPARPVLPAALSRSSPEEQRRSHAAWMERVEEELRQRQRHGPGPDPRQHRRDTELLLHERRRYETYVRVLESWLRGEGAEPRGEAEAAAGAPPRAPPALSRARSSPALGPGAAAPPPARVRRNASERGTLRGLVPQWRRERP
ncbi:LOW QUALITY PROTEIN: PH and SEC7 domain-containing protein 4-like [Ara ararauna]